jgi:hypothetical protein
MTEKGWLLRMADRTGRSPSPGRVRTSNHLETDIAALGSRAAAR